MKPTKNNLRIATWNCCLGLFNKKDAVSLLLEENSIDILALQETEITKDMGITPFHIRGFTCEIEESLALARTACYVSNTINYQRRSDLEKADIHVIIMDILEGKTYAFLAYIDLLKSMKQKQAEKCSSRNWN